jgi:hypothetical protein
MIVCKSCQAYTLLQMLMSDPSHQLEILRCPGRQYLWNFRIFWSLNSAHESGKKTRLGRIIQNQEEF